MRAGVRQVHGGSMVPEVHGGSETPDAITLALPRVLAPAIVVALCRNQATLAMSATAQTSPSQARAAGIVGRSVVVIMYLRIALCLSGFRPVNLARPVWMLSVRHLDAISAAAYAMADDTETIGRRWRWCCKFAPS